MQIESPRRRSKPPAAGLLVEAIVGVALVAVVAARLDLRDFTVALPCCVVAAAAGLLAFAVRSRSVFWFGALGGIVGALCTPRVYITLSPGADPAERELIWSQTLGEMTLQYAFPGGMVGVAVGYAVSRVLRRYTTKANKGMDERTGNGLMTSGGRSRRSSS